MATIYIMEHERLKTILTNESKENPPLSSAILKEVLNGETTLTFSTPSDHEESENVKAGHWAVVRDPEGDFISFKIVDELEEHSRDGLLRIFETEEIAVTELNDEVIEALTLEKVPRSTALAAVLAGTRWQVGRVDDDESYSLKLNRVTVMAGIQAILETWGGELKFRVELDDQNNIVGRYVDIINKRGENRGRRFEYGKDIENVSRRIDIRNLKTAVYVYGKGIENQTEETEGIEENEDEKPRVTIENVEWSVSNGDPIDKPLGQKWIGDPAALALWGHRDKDGNLYHRKGIYIDENIDDPLELIKAGWKYLQEVGKPAVTYEMNVLDLEYIDKNEFRHEAVRLGDDVYVIDRKFAWEIELETRLVEIERDLLDPRNTKVVLGTQVKDLSNLVKSLQDKIEKKLNQSDPIDWLEGDLNLKTRRIVSGTSYIYMGDSQQYPGIFIPDKPESQNPTSGILATSGGILIANSLKPDGSLNWRTAITGDGMIADTIMSGMLRTDLVTIGDADQNVKIDKNGVLVKNGLIRVERPDGYPVIIGGRLNLDLEIQPAEPPITSPNVGIGGDLGIWWYTTETGNPQNLQFYTYEHKARYLVVRVFLYAEPGATAHFSIETGRYSAGNVVVLGSVSSTNTDPTDEENRANELKIDLGTPTGNRRSFYARLKSNDPTKKVYARITRKWLEG